MKKLKTILVALVVGVICSCTKDNLAKPIPLQSEPRKKDTLINNPIPRVPIFGNEAR